MAYRKAGSYRSNVEDFEPVGQQKWASQRSPTQETLFSHQKQLSKGTSMEFEHAIEGWNVQSKERVSQHQSDGRRSTIQAEDGHRGIKERLPKLNKTSDYGILENSIKKSMKEGHASGNRSVEYSQRGITLKMVNRKKHSTP